MSNRKKIDFRVRPPYKKGLPLFDDPYGKSKWVGLGFEPSRSETEKSVERLVQELDEAGVDIAVLPGRGAFGEQTEELFELADQYPGRFVVFPFVDPLEGQKALDNVDQYVIHGKGKGIAIEPALQTETYHFNDKRAFPLYKKLEDNNIPLLITYTAFSDHYLDPFSVRYLEEVVTAFPKLNVIVAHGVFPFTREAIGLIFTHHNFYIIPDSFGLWGPGGDDYINAANTFASDNLIYGSSYPAMPIVATAEAYEQRPFKDEETKNKFFYGNAARLLGLG